MSKSLSNLPYEDLICHIFGDQWRLMTDRELDGALGVAIVKSIYDGVPATLEDIAAHLGLSSDMLSTAYNRLYMNGALSKGRIESDSLSDDNITAWCYYAGYASGFTGPWLSPDDK